FNGVSWPCTSGSLRRQNAERHTSLQCFASSHAPEECRAPIFHRDYLKIKNFLKILGPGLITGASDDDPSGIGTYSVAGASLGFATLWTALATIPMMSSVQF